MFQAAFHPAFKKDIKNLNPGVIEKLKKAVDLILSDPYAHPKLKGELKDIFKMVIKHQGI